MKNIVWCSPHPNHYNIYLLENLNSMEGVSVQAVYFEKKITRYPWKTDFTSTVHSSVLNKSLYLDLPFILRALRSRDLYIIAGWNELTMFILITVFSLLGRKYILYSDTPSLHERKGFSQKLRSIWMNWIFKRVWYFFVTGTPGVNSLMKLGMNKERIINFPFATNNSFFVPRLHSLDENDQRIFISSGRLDINHKGYDVALKAFAALKGADLGKKFKYLIAGDGPDKGKIIALVKELGLEEEVDLLGWLEPEQLLNFYHKGHVFVHPSNFDPFPNAVLEAMSSGLPVVGSDAAGSVLDRVQNDFNGYIHRSGNPESLCEKLKIILGASDSKLSKLGENARATSLNWTVEYNKSVIKSILNKENNEVGY